jgi:hypothetical protein
VKITKYKFDVNYFYNIDTPTKAYWLGFIWCDGSMIVRRRGKSLSYCMKLSLKKEDASHIEKFNKSINGNYNVKIYSTKNYTSNNYKEARIAIYNQHFGKTLYHKYNMVPYRENAQKIIEATPPKYYRDLIRGMFDADGSFSIYQANTQYGIKKKYAISFGGSELLCRWIEEVLINNNLCLNMKHKLYKRHEGKDGSFVTLSLSGRRCVSNILHWLYYDNSTYLNRKYQKFIDNKLLLTDRG